jgi:hypothetical protein
MPKASKVWVAGVQKCEIVQAALVGSAPDLPCYNFSWQSAPLAP